MGRYWSTINGREGKFMFGVQSSDDPGALGMHEQEPTHIDYYADEDDVEDITENLDKQYDELGVPQEKRIYYIKKDNWQEYDKYEQEVLHDKVFMEVREDDEEEKAKHGHEIVWASRKEGYICYEIKGKALCLARVRLALSILSDIKDEGCCELEAEL